MNEAPDFKDIEAWINSPALRLGDLVGKVVFLDFWTYSCGNCARTLPHMRELHEKYGGKGLVVVGVHAPEFSFEKDLANVKKTVKDAGLTYPIALDNDHSTWKRYGNTYWPRQALVDANGVLRFEHVGEDDYDEIEGKVREILAEVPHQPR